MPRFFFDIHDGEDFTPNHKAWTWTILTRPRTRPGKPSATSYGTNCRSGTGATLPSMSRTRPERSSGGLRCLWSWKPHPKAQQQAPDTELRIARNPLDGAGRYLRADGDRMIPKRLPPLPAGLIEASVAEGSVCSRR